MTTEAELIQRMADLGVTYSGAFELMLGKVRERSTHDCVAGSTPNTQLKTNLKDYQ